MQRPARWFVDYDCLLTKEPVWHATWQDTGGKPCQLCPYSGACRLRHYVTHPTATEKAISDMGKTKPQTVAGPQITNAVAAEFLGISKRQAAKLRRDGKLREALEQVKGS